MSGFLEISIILLFASLLAYFARTLKQPVILAYIIAGIVIGPIGLKIVGNRDFLDNFATFGIALLLFIVGLELNFTKLRQIGKLVITIAFFQIIITGLLSYLFIHSIYGNSITTIYLALILIFSSTIIVVKLLAENKMIDHLFGRIALGVLIVQDLLVIFAIVFLESLSGNTSADLAYVLFATIGKSLLLFLTVWGFGHYVVNSIFKKVAKYPEILFLLAVSWCLVGANFAQFLGLSIEIGAFLAGVSIASGVYTLEISAKIKPLRDFFVILFFVILGIQTNFTAITNYWIVLYLILFIIIVHPLVMLVIMGIMGFKRKTSFASGIALTQISEFSLLIAILGLKLGHLNDETVSIITLVAIITIIISTYLITNWNKIYTHLGKYLKIFERRETQWEENNKKTRLYFDHAILAGARRTGFSIMKTLKNHRIKFVVVDFNPELVGELSDKNIPVVFGDITDYETLNNLNVREAKMFISTIPDYEDNMLTLKNIRHLNHKIFIIVTAETTDEAIALYKNGANYVLLPHHISGEHVSDLIRKQEDSNLDITKIKETHLKKLEKHLAQHGNEH